MKIVEIEDLKRDCIGTNTDLIFCWIKLILYNDSGYFRKGMDIICAMILGYTPIMKRTS